MNKEPIRKLLMATGLVWLFSAPFTSFLMSTVFDELHISISPLRSLALFGACSGAGAISLSFLVPDTYRVLIRECLVGFLILGASTMFFASSLAYFVLAPHPLMTTWLLRGLFLLAFVWWNVRELRSYRQRIIKSRFIEREFSIEDDRINLRHPSKTRLDSPPVSDSTFFGKLYHRFGGYLIMLIPFGYPVQRLFYDTGGAGAVLLLETILCTPVVFYISGRLSCGAYLYVYKVWQLERRYGKPVVFDSND